MVPAGFNGADVIDVAYRRYNFALGAGLNKVAGKLFRIGHLGDLNEITLLAGHRAAPRWRCATSGIKVELGKGVAAAQQYWLETQKPLPAKKVAGPGRGRGGQEAGGGRVSHTRFEPARPRLQRSELAVPGSNPAMFEKALTCAADYVFLDLEDAVAPADKEQARLNVIEALQQVRLARARQDDLRPGERHRHPLLLPRHGGRGRAGRAPAGCGAGAQGRACPAMSTSPTRCSPRSRRRRGSPHRIGIDVLIETALGMANVEAIAQPARSGWRRCTSAWPTMRRACGRAP